MDAELKAKLRPLAREKAAWFSQQLAEVSSAGGNVHQASIDLQDQIEEFIRTLPEGEREGFEVLYVEELNANTASINDQTSAVLQRTVEATTQAAVGAQVFFAIISIVVFLVAMFVIMRR